MIGHGLDRQHLPRPQSGTDALDEHVQRIARAPLFVGQQAVAGDLPGRGLQRPHPGDLPVLGKLFRSRAYRDRQTELVVFITPRFVAGVNDTAPRDDAADVEAARQQAATVRERGDWARERARFVD